MTKNFVNFLLSFLLIFLVFSCSNKEKSKTVNVQIDFKSFIGDVSKNGQTKVGPRAVQSGWGQTAPSTIGGYNCFAVLAYWNEIETTTSCVNSTGIVLSTPQLISGSYPVASTPSITLAIPSGQGRTFQVFGFYSASGTCPNFKTITLADKGNLSFPAILGSKVVDIQGDNMALTINLALSGRQEVEHCSGPLVSWEKPSSSPHVVSNISYGNERIVVSGSNLLAVTGATLTGNGTTYSLGIESQTTSELILGALTSGLNLLKNGLYSLIISDAIGATTYTISVTGGTTVINSSWSGTLTAAQSGQMFLISPTLASPAVSLPTVLSDGVTFTLKNVTSNVGFISYTFAVDGTADAVAILPYGAASFISYSNNWYLYQSNGGAVKGQSSFCSNPADCYSNTALINKRFILTGGSYYIFDFTTYAWKSVLANTYLINKLSSSVVTQTVAPNYLFARAGALKVIQKSTNNYYYNDEMAYSAFRERSPKRKKEPERTGTYVSYDTANTFCQSLGMSLPDPSITKASDGAGTPGVACASGGEYCWTTQVIDGTHHATWRDAMPLNTLSDSTTLDTGTSNNYVVCVISAAF